MNHILYTISKNLHLGDFDLKWPLIIGISQLSHGRVDIRDEFLPAEELDTVAVLQAESLDDDALNLDDFHVVIGHQSKWYRKYSVSILAWTWVWLCNRLFMSVSRRNVIRMRVKLGEWAPFSLLRWSSSCAAFNRCSTDPGSLLLMWY